MSSTIAYSNVRVNHKATLWQELFDFNMSLFTASTSRAEDFHVQGYRTLSQQVLPEIGKNDVLIFDMDGTIVNTDACNTKAYKEAIDIVLGLGVSQMFDIPRIERALIQEKLSWVSEIQLNKIIHLKEMFYTQHIDEVATIPSTMEVLERFSSTNMIVLATNARRQRVMQTIQHLNLGKVFDAIITKDDCTMSDKFITALSRLNLDPKKVWVFENEKREADKAVAAGININHVILA